MSSRSAETRACASFLSDKKGPPRVAGCSGAHCQQHLCHFRDFVAGEVVLEIVSSRQLGILERTRSAAARGPNQALPARPRQFQTRPEPSSATNTNGFSDISPSPSRNSCTLRARAVPFCIGGTVLTMSAGRRPRTRRAGERLGELPRRKQSAR